MSESVPISPSPLKSALLMQGSDGHVPARQAKNASMSASVPTSPSQLKSMVPQKWPLLHEPAPTHVPPAVHVPPRVAHWAEVSPPKHWLLARTQHEPWLGRTL